MIDFPLWAERLYNKPVALDRYKNEVLCEFAQARIVGRRSDRIDATTLDMASRRAVADEASHYGENGRKAFASKDGIAVVPVRGTLVQRSGWLDAESGLVGYNGLLRALRAASNDPEIGGIFMPFDSGGGECAGMFAAAEEIASMAASEGGKPIYAYLDERACSAAYVLASATDRIVGRREVMGASIAAIANIVDTSRAYEKAGLEPIIVRPTWADRKARGGSGEKVDKETIKRLGELVDEASDQIVEFVSAMRGLSEDSIRAMRGDVKTGVDLIKLGLMDDIMSEREAWAALKAQIGN